METCSSRRRDITCSHLVHSELLTSTKQSVRLEMPSTTHKPSETEAATQASPPFFLYLQLKLASPSLTHQSNVIHIVLSDWESFVSPVPLQIIWTAIGRTHDATCKIGELKLPSFFFFLAAVFFRDRLLASLPRFMFSFLPSLHPTEKPSTHHVLKAQTFI